MEALADDAAAAAPTSRWKSRAIPMRQGGEGGNLALSQARAEAVLLGLQGRRVLVGALTAKGYGETAPDRRQRHRSGPRGEPPDRIHLLTARGRAPAANAIATA